MLYNVHTNTFQFTEHQLFLFHKIKTFQSWSAVDSININFPINHRVYQIAASMSSSSSSTTSVELPKFITREFLQNLVQKYLKDETTLKIGNFWGEWATKRGDNYASDMYRLHVDYTHLGVNKRKSVLLKVRVISLSLSDKCHRVVCVLFGKLT